MATTVDGLRLRKVLGRDDWLAPKPFGLDGWSLLSREPGASIIVSVGPVGFGPDQREWIHASISRDDRMPSYDDLALLHRAVFRDGWAYQVFAPSEHHVNLHAHALHLWGLVDGSAVLPNFGEFGTI